MGARDRVVVRTKRALRHMSPRHIIRTRLSARMLRRYADKVGLVYFGAVNQGDDEHRLVRGHTVSATHMDDHYSVGTIHDYDVAVVLRNDIVRVGKGREQRCHWLIVTFDLHTKYDLPHIYIGHRSKQEIYRASYSQLMPLPVGTLVQYPANFTANYAVYGTPAHALTIERLITPQIATIIMSHFAEASVEIEDNTVYLYVESRYPNETILEKMVSNGLWLANNIDAMLAPRPTNDN